MFAWHARDPESNLQYPSRPSFSNSLHCLMNKHAAHGDKIACLDSFFPPSLHVRPPTSSTG